MPGYYIHLAASNPLARKNRSFVCGVEVPDLLKNYLKSSGISGAKEKYNVIKTSNMPDFSYFELRIQQKEKSGSNDGLHYGLSSNPDIICFWNSLTDEQKKNPFYIGYLWHLLTDLLMYKCLDIDKKFSEFMSKHTGDENLSKLQKQEVNKLHTDWNKTNAKIREKYPDVILPPEVEELGIVKFINDNQIDYVDWDIIKSLTDYMRLFNPLNEDVNMIIETIINLLPDSKSPDVKDTLSKNLVLSRKKIFDKREVKL